VQTGRALSKAEAQQLLSVIDDADEVVVAALRDALSIVLGIVDELGWEPLVGLAASRGGWGERRIERLQIQDRTYLEDLLLELNELRELEHRIDPGHGHEAREAAGAMERVLNALASADFDTMRRQIRRVEALDVAGRFRLAGALCDLLADALERGEVVRREDLDRVADALGPGPLAAIVEMIER